MFEQKSKNELKQESYYSQRDFDIGATFCHSVMSFSLKKGLKIEFEQN